MTGGLEKTVTLAGQTLPSDQPLAFQNAKKVALTVEKKVDAGALTVEGEHTFTFALYAADRKTILDTQKVTVPDGAKDGAVFTAVFEGLSQGQTYCLEEIPEDEDFVLTGMEGKNGLSVAQSGTLYEFTVPASK